MFFEPDPILHRDLISESPLECALALAHFFHIPVMPLHGVRVLDDGSYECACRRPSLKRALKKGEPIQPCLAPGKFPQLSGWPEKATADIQTIRNWGVNWPLANFAALTGPESGFIAIDVDGSEGQESLLALEERLGPLPPTWRAESGRKAGGHIYLRTAKDTTILNSVNRLGPKIDVRGYHGYIVIPPSLHIGGKRYAWQEGSSPRDVPFAFVPDSWLAELTGTRSPNIPKAKTAETAVRHPTPRNHSTSLVLGDGDGRGGFHAPINGIAVKYFSQFGADVDAAALKQSLRQAVLEAPTIDRGDSHVERYASDSYLDDAIESARTYVRQKEN